MEPTPSRLRVSLPAMTRWTLRWMARTRCSAPTLIARNRADKGERMNCTCTEALQSEGRTCARGGVVPAAARVRYMSSTVCYG